MKDTTVQELEATFDALSEAWKDGDGEAFARWCTSDVDFINLLGIHVRGRRAVEDLHEKIFRGPYEGSTVTFTVESVRMITPAALLAIVPSRVDVPSGPVKGIVATIATVLLVRESDRWRVASFHNTRRESTQPDHLSIMRKAVEG